MKIIHLSDLHFGTERPGLIEALIADCEQVDADLIVISGDLTQRATHQQYQAVKNFLEEFQEQIICVPGNHDISLYNIFERFIFPFAKFQKYITNNFHTQYADENVAILGINSVTPYKSMSGYVTDDQLGMIREFFLTQPDKAAKIIVMHHNLIKSERHRIINDADKILKTFAESKVNIVMSGHIHVPMVEQIKKPYINQPLYIITAGTAISTRTAAPNSYNILEIQDQKFNLIVKNYENQKFIVASKTTLSLI